MAFDWVGGIKVAILAIKAAIPIGRRVVAEKQAGQNPSKNTPNNFDHLFNGAIGRLGSITPTDSIWKKVSFRAGALLTRRDQFTKPHVQEWLSLPDVREALRKTVELELSGALRRAEDNELLLSTYMDKSGEDLQHADSVVSTAIAVLKASLQNAPIDRGTAALVEAGFKSTHDKLDTIVDRLDEGSDTLGQG